MIGAIVVVLIVFAVIGTLIRYAPSPREISDRERQRRIATERLCATLLAADDNPMYVIPPKAIELANQLTTSKELNP
jgi:hypothetical protein